MNRLLEWIGRDPLRAAFVLLSLTVCLIGIVGAVSTFA